MHNVLGCLQMPRILWCEGFFATDCARRSCQCGHSNFLVGTDERTPDDVRMHTVTEVPEGVPTICGQGVSVAGATQPEVRLHQTLFRCHVAMSGLDTTQQIISL